MATVSTQTIIIADGLEIYTANHDGRQGDVEIVDPFITFRWSLDNDLLYYAEFIHGDFASEDPHFLWQEVGIPVWGY